MVARAIQIHITFRRWSNVEGGHGGLMGTLRAGDVLPLHDDDGVFEILRVENLPAGQAVEIWAWVPRSAEDSPSAVEIVDVTEWWRRPLIGARHLWERFTRPVGRVE